jgi:tetratricopeptide (TPR) repeat protein
MVASRRNSIVFPVIALVFAAGIASAQPKTYELVDGRWVLAESQPVVQGDPNLVMARERLARGSDDAAVAMLDEWFEKNPDPRGSMVPEALILRGDAHLAGGDEYRALLDYERVARDFSGTDALPIALERELRVANLYLNGLRVKMWGMFRIDSGRPLAEEIIIRINERLPGSRLAEQALLDLADHYYRERELRQAADTYDVFLKLFPSSDKRQIAMQRRLYANIAKFKGPQYDASSLIEAQVQIEEYAAEFPAQAREKGLDDALTARLQESLAAEMLETARWYLRVDDPVSARLTLNRLVRAHPRTQAAIDAQAIMQPRGWLPTPEQPGTLKPREPELVVPFEGDQARERGPAPSGPTAPADTTPAELGPATSRDGGSTGVPEPGNAGATP